MIFRVHLIVHARIELVINLKLCYLQIRSLTKYTYIMILSQYSNIVLHFLGMKLDMNGKNCVGGLC